MHERTFKEVLILFTIINAMQYYLV